MSMKSLVTGSLLALLTGLAQAVPGVPLDAQPLGTALSLPLGSESLGVLGLTVACVLVGVRIVRRKRDR